VFEDDVADEDDDDDDEEVNADDAEDAVSEKIYLP